MLKILLPPLGGIRGGTCVISNFDKKTGVISHVPSMALYIECFIRNDK